ALALSIGVVFGVTAGYFGGPWDSFVSNFLNVILAFPFILLALALIPILGSGFHNIILVLGVTIWPIFCRVTRSKTLQIKAMTYVEAAHAVGLPRHLILIRYVLPNLVDSVITLASLEAARMVIMESFLSFIGLGIPPPTPSWGLMIGEGREYIFTQWWLTTFPGMALFIVTLGFALFGDGLRDFLDPTIE
ncbi:MAG: ABC transporter permease, partial [Candidatus Hodarchaeota archaeon]